MALDTARRLARRNERVRRLLRRLYRNGQYLSARLLGKFRRDELTMLYVDPQDIQMTVARDDPTLTGNSVWHFGSVAGGDWDLSGVPVREHGDVYTILAKRVQEGLAYEEIPEFTAHLRAIEEGALLDSCTTPEEYMARWREIEGLYGRIAAEGYKTQEELGGDNPLDEIRIQIGRRGELLFEEGLHRLAIAQLLALPQIPVLVTRRHEQWARLRHALIKIVLQRGFFHQPFNHPDLDSLPALYGNELGARSMYGNERWQFIVNSLPLSSGTVLDIGAYFGYFDHRLEALGFVCTAVEPDEENLEVLKRYRAMMGRTFAVREQSIFDIEEADFDIVLALNIFHHLVRTKREYEQLVAFLRRLRCRAMYFEPDDNAGVEAYRRFSDEEFVAFVLQHSVLNEARLLGRAKEGRNVYLLT